MRKKALKERERKKKENKRFKKTPQLRSDRPNSAKQESRPNYHPLTETHQRGPARHLSQLQNRHASKEGRDRAGQSALSLGPEGKGRIFTAEQVRVAHEAGSRVPCEGGARVSLVPFLFQPVSSKTRRKRHPSFPFYFVCMCDRYISQFHPFTGQHHPAQAKRSATARRRQVRLAMAHTSSRTASSHPSMGTNSQYILIIPKDSAVST